MAFIQGEGALRNSQATFLSNSSPRINSTPNGRLGFPDPRLRSVVFFKRPVPDDLNFDWSVEMTEELDGSGKNCPICCQQLPLSEFGVCRARHDGRNLYCKSCIRKKVTDSRRALKEYRSARKRGVGQLVSEQSAEPSLDGNSAPSANYPRMLNKLSPVERVREAIRKGALTQREIAQETRLGKDEIGDALANLLLWTREIRTEVVDNTRHYYLNESEASVLREETRNIPSRKRDLPSSFSALQGLMPGKNPEGEPEKIGGWVAA